MPAYKQPVTLNIAGSPFTFRQRVVADLPDAPQFLEGLLARQTISPPVAAHYVKIVSRLKRQGKLADLGVITHTVERTAANAYVRWRAESYELRIAPVARLLARHLKNKSSIRNVRVHGFVPPSGMTGVGKKIPRVTAPPPVSLDSIRDQIGKYVEPAPLQLHITWVESTAWTLHVPEKPCAVHTDPCESCVAIELNDEELAVIAVAFEQAWGHREFWKLPPDAYLFGEPPPDGTSANGKTEDPRRKALELLAWFYDAVSPADRMFKNWDDAKWTELCALLGKPTGL